MDILKLLELGYPSCIDVSDRNICKANKIMDRLVDILSRRFSAEKDYLSYTSDGYSEIKGVSTSFLSEIDIERIATEKGCFSGRLDLSCDCGIDSWNQSSGFLYNLEDMYFIAQAMCISGNDLSSVTEEDISEALEYSYYYEDGDDVLDVAAGVYERLMELRKVVENRDIDDTISDYTAMTIEDFHNLIIGDDVLLEDVIDNIEFILSFCFGFGEGANRKIITFKSDDIANYLKIKDTLPRTALTEKMDKLVSLFSECGGADYAFTSYGETYTVTGFFERAEGDDMRLFSPFFHLIFDEIKETYKEICATFLLESGTVFFFVHFCGLFADFIL